MNLGFTLAVDGYWGVAALALLTPFGAKALMALLRKGPPRAQRYPWMDEPALLCRYVGMGRWDWIMLGLCGAWLAVLVRISPEPLAAFSWLWSSTMAAWVQAIGTIAVAAWGFISWRREAAAKQRAAVKAHEDELQRYDALLRAASDEVRGIARGFEGGLTIRRNWLKRHRNGRLRIYRAELDRIPIQRLLDPTWIVDAVDALLEFDILMRMIDELAEAVESVSDNAEAEGELDAQCFEIARQADGVDLQLQFFRSFLDRSLTLSAGERLTVRRNLN